MQESPRYFELIRRAIFGGDSHQRYTQDSPVLPQVWLEYARNPLAFLDLLLTPHRRFRPGELANAISLPSRELVRANPPSVSPLAERLLSYNESYVVGRFTFEELCSALLPLTPWFRSRVLRPPSESEPWSIAMIADLEGALRKPPGSEYGQGKIPADLIWLTRILGLIELARRGLPVAEDPWAPGHVAPDNVRGASVVAEITLAALDRFRQMPVMPQDTPGEDTSGTPLWLVNLNRPAGLAVSASRQTVKADVVERAFAPDIGGIRWAIVDTGVDARHPAFRRRDAMGVPAVLPSEGEWGAQSRIVETYDFSRLRRLVSPVLGGPDSAVDAPDPAQLDLQNLQQTVIRGGPVPWDLLRPLLRVPHDLTYTPPTNGHGTHVAGILAADWRGTDQSDLPELVDLRGVCPAIELYDFRVFSPEGNGDEFEVIAALQFARWLNAQSEHSVLHGVNISVSIQADVQAYACGRTPVCEECQRLTSNGVVTVVAAGNEAYDYPMPFARRFGTYHEISVTDPGNTEAVITVGSTHRERPHTYGVSYFSSRGPTADGRMKPDLVAPGEKIVSLEPNRKMGTRDGTSMAAPHVSGAAALLMARYRELVGEPARIKRILMDTATDLGRERRFQGAGLIDISRALHAI